MESRVGGSEYRSEEEFFAASRDLGFHKFSPGKIQGPSAATAAEDEIRAGRNRRG